MWQTKLSIKPDRNTVGCKVSEQRARAPARPRRRRAEDE